MMLCLQLFESVKEESTDLTDSPTLPRKQIMFRRHDQSSGQQHQFIQPSDYFCQQKLCQH